MNLIYSTKMIIAGNVVEIYKYEKAQRRGKDAYKTKAASSGGGSITNEEERKMRDEKNLKDSARRAKQTLRRSINANVGKHGQRDKFFTLTYKENMKDLEQGNNDFREFIKRLNRKIFKKQSGLKYVCVVERQERGAIHYHVIFFNLPFVPVNELAELWGHGFVKINEIENVDNVGAYVVKYMTKTIVEDGKGSAKEKGKKMYFSSRNLDKPREVIPTAAQLERIQKHVVYENSFENEFTGNVIYQQANLQRQQSQQ